MHALAATVALGTGFEDTYSALHGDRPCMISWLLPSLSYIGVLYLVRYMQ